MEPENLIFVYGTLRSGHSNHHLLKEATCIGVGNTVDSYAMYLISGYPYVTSSEARYPIIGELFKINDSTLTALDKMEGHPRYYERIEIHVVVDGKQQVAWMYFKDPPGILMQNGDFSNVSCEKSIIAK